MIAAASGNRFGPRHAGPAGVGEATTLRPVGAFAPNLAPPILQPSCAARTSLASGATGTDSVPVPASSAGGRRAAGAHSASAAEAARGCSEFGGARQETALHRSRRPVVSIGAAA